MDGRHNRIQYVSYVLLYLSLFSRLPLTVVSVNCLGIRVFGELEFWFASIKVTTLIGLILFGIIVGQLVSFKTDIFFLVLSFVQISEATHTVTVSGSATGKSLVWSRSSPGKIVKPD